MNPFSVSEVTEDRQNKFAECDLGKAAERWKASDDFPNSANSAIYDVSLAIIAVDIRNCPLENGHWEGERGNSKWVPDPDYVPQKSNLEGKTWGEILEKHGIDGIKYTDGEPVFDNVSKGTVTIEGFSSERSDNFDKADTELAKQRGYAPEEVRAWRKENGFTWHECKDMETMQKVPCEIHNNVSHRGGVSNSKAVEG